MMPDEGDDMKYNRSGSFSEPTTGGIHHASDGGYYHVWLFGTRWECECTGFRTFGKPCKHISNVRDSIRSDNKKQGVISFFNTPI